MKVVLRVAYDGSAFAGFQRQPQAKTVQGTLEAAASQILGHPVGLQGAGRTDVGVHATGQIVAFTSPSVKSLVRLCHSINSVLREPKAQRYCSSIAVVEGALLDDEDPFHPRFSATARTYSYFILDGSRPREAMFWSGRAWCLPQTLDLELAEEAAHLFNGELDFSTFSYRMQEMETRVRTVSAIAIGEQKADLLQGEAGGPRLLRLSITANGFLRRMVRLIAAGVVEVAMGHRSLVDLQSRLQARDPSRAPHPAPPEGLYLERIVYDPDPFTTHRGTSRHALATLPTQHRVKR